MTARSTTRLPQFTHNPMGFTILEIMIVLFLLAGLLALVIPRISIGDSLGSTSRKWIASLNSLRDLAAATQKTVRLYVDLDKGQYWPMMIEGREEKLPLDPTWATPLTLPESIRITDLQVGSTKSNSGRADLFIYPNGRIDPVTMHFADNGNNVLGLQIEPITGNIRVTDQRIDPPAPWTVPERVKPLLQIQPTLPGAKPLPFGKP